jgi:hypothetical protein
MVASIVILCRNGGVESRLVFAGAKNACALRQAFLGPVGGMFIPSALFIKTGSS